MNARLYTLPLVLVLGISSAARAADAPLGTAIDYLTVAQIAGQRGEWKTAERIVRDGMIAHPGSDGFHLGLGYVLENQGRFTDAFYEYQYEVLRSGNPLLAKEAARKSAAILEREDADEPHRVMTAIALAESDPAYARKLLAAIGPKTARPFALRVYEAECAQMVDDRAAAEAQFRALLSTDPAFVPGYLALASLLDASGRTDEATALRADAKAINPNHWALAP